MMRALLDEVTAYTPRRGKSYSHKIDKNDSEVAASGSHLLQFVFFIALVLGIYLLFIGRAVNVQIANKESYLGLAEQNRIREFSILPSRGLIYDRDGTIIVRNKPRFSVELNTLICKVETSYAPCEQAIQDVTTYIELDDTERVTRELENKRTNILLASAVELDDILGLEANISKMPGVSIETAPARDYLVDEAFAHAIGYVGLGETLTPTIEGKTGVEERYDEELSGVGGNKIVQVDSAGTSYQLISQKAPLPGKDVTLFLDSELQQKAYAALAAKIGDPESTATGGAIVAQNPIDGSVLALVSYPGFDPNQLSGGISQEELAELNQNPNFPFFNRAISAAYPPGSTFKLVTASAILMEEIADAFTTIVDAGFIQIGSFIFRNWKLDGHGEVNLARALQVSNDTYFYIMGGGYGGVGGLGITKLHDWSTRYGYGSLTGIDINGEVSGFMPDGTHREWYLGDDYISSIGQGDILATPLQVNNMMTYFANGGYLFVPRVVKSVDGVGDTEVNVLGQNLISDEVYDLIRRGVNLAAEPGGTGYPVFDFQAIHGIEVMGKTGTSEFVTANGEEKTHAWFTAAAPYYEDAYQQASMSFAVDRPIVLTVFLEGGGSGSSDAAPLARELLDFWFE